MPSTPGQVDAVRVVRAIDELLAQPLAPCDTSLLELTARPTPRSTPHEIPPRRPL